jgi:hypothetical protein
MRFLARDQWVNIVHLANFTHISAKDSPAHSDPASLGIDCRIKVVTAKRHESASDVIGEAWGLSAVKRFL